MMNNKIILMIIPGLGKGGAEKNFSLLVTSSSLRENGIRPYVVAIIGGYYLKILRGAGIECVCLLEDKRIIGFFKRIGLLIKSVFKYRVVCIHAFMPIAGFIGVMIKCVVRCPMVYAVRSTSSATLVFKKKPLIAFYHRISLLGSDIVTAVSDYVAEDLRKFTSKKCEVIYNAIDIVPLRTRKDYYKSVVTVAHMRDYGKDIFTVLKVAQRLKEYRFVIVGDGAKKQEYERFAIQERIDNVCFEGFQENVTTYLEKSDIMLNLTYFEGFPNTVIEGIACGLPVIVSDIPVLRRLFTDGKECLFVRNGDVEEITNAIKNLYSDSVKYHQLVLSGYESIKERFSTTLMIQKNLSVYKRLLYEN